MQQGWANKLAWAALKSRV